MCDCAECISERKSSYEQAPNSRSLFWLLTKAMVHSFFLQVSAFFPVLQTHYPFTHLPVSLEVVRLASHSLRFLASLARGRTVTSMRDAPLNMS